MAKIALLTLTLFVCLLVNAQINYDLKLSNPNSHYFEVQMNVKNIKGKTFEIKMPVWTPGSYLVRDFSKNVNLVKAYDENGKALRVYKTRKNAWQIENGKAKNIRINYEVYAFEQSVRTSYLDNLHGFVSPSGVFMYAEQFRYQGGHLTVTLPSGFAKITTALEEKSGETVVGDGMRTYTYEDYDQLIDCPIEIGNQTVFEFTASGCKHVVAMYGKADYNIENLKRDMAKIVTAATNIWGENPNKRYVFIVHNVTDGQGGLEHRNSTTLSVNRFIYKPETYNRFMTLVAHEYFHLWNVKRLRAKVLGPFNYDEEVYTPLLYVMEGFNSFYQDLVTYKAGFTTDGEYLNTRLRAINYVEGTPGSRVQPLADASFDAWIKAYKPNENSSNTTMTYYSRGSVIASLMDAMIIKKFDGKKTLDDFMRLLYQKYYKAKNVGFTSPEFEKDFSDFIGEDESQFFAKYVQGTEIPDYESIFGAIGIKVTRMEQTTPSLGLTMSGSSVRIVCAGSAAEKAGISPNDEIVAVNGYRTEGSDVNDLLSRLDVGETAQLVVNRDGVLLELKLTNENYTKLQFKFDLEDGAAENPMTRAFFRL